MFLLQSYDLLIKKRAYEYELNNLSIPTKKKSLAYKEQCSYIDQYCRTSWEDRVTSQAFIF